MFCTFTVECVANEREDLKELESSAVKMLRIHYMNLGRTKDEKKNYLEKRKTQCETIIHNREVIHKDPPLS